MKKTIFLTSIGLVLLLSSTFVAAYNLVQNNQVNADIVSATPIADIIIAPSPVPVPTPAPNSEPSPVIVVEKPVGSWMTLFLMHNKFNPETKKWEKKILPKSELRGTYNFVTKKWTKK